MRIAIVGCGYVADLYLETLAYHRDLELIGVYDRDEERKRRFASFYQLHPFTSLDELFSDPRIEMVLNLTTPESHYAISRASLDSGKHVYTEKPLATDMNDAKELVRHADSMGLRIASAPSRVLGETAQTFWHALRSGSIGTPLLAYAEMDDGLVHKMPYQGWSSRSGTPWPYKNEFEVGCTLEHAGYSVTWLTAFFGPADSVTSFASCQVADKETEEPLGALAPDFSVACIQFRSGVVARLTCSIIAPRDHAFRVFGDRGLLYVDDIWKARAPVYMKRLISIRRRQLALPRKRIPLLGRSEPRLQTSKMKKVDFCLGVTELATAIKEHRTCRLSPEFCLHVNEIVLAIQNSRIGSNHHPMTTSFAPPDPMPWAR